MNSTTATTNRCRITGQASCRRCWRRRKGFGPFTGKQIILATVVGYELGTRIGNTVSPHAFNRGFHPCGLTSTFAAAATMGKLLKLNVDQFVNALGLAGSQAAGLMASQYGAMAKRFHSGKAAQNGMLAAMLAGEGLTGVRNVLEAPYGGFCSTYAEKYDLSYATERARQGIRDAAQWLQAAIRRWPAAMLRSMRCAPSARSMV